MVQPRYLERPSALPNPRTARAATQRRIVHKSRARYTRPRARVGRRGHACSVLLMGYVLLTASLTGHVYAVAKAEHRSRGAAGGNDAARRSHRGAALGRPSSQLAARLGMREPQRIAVVRIVPPHVARRALALSRCFRRWPGSSCRRYPGNRRVTTSARCINERSHASPPCARALFFYACWSWRLSGVAALRRSGTARAPFTRARRWPNDPIPSKSLRAAAASSTATATSSSALCRRRASTPCRATSSIPMRRRQGSKRSLAGSTPRRSPRCTIEISGSSGSRAKFRTIRPRACARSVCSASDLKEEETGLRVDTSGTVGIHGSRLRRNR